ncbi:CRM1 C terminal Exportin 1-like protein [Phytophthora cinnamomi]|uniref:CRM1 C terminal Exportin 1-like protein n=1 Tax=Phytophthora cinnamomi TaxID=4785 RepID=UPI003559E71C|nr:CRM1 C terminal Exportin 1-like protein [Phytophthora cinnamomi]
MEAVGQKLLDFSQPFDVAALDQVVQCMNDPKSPHQRVANQIMVALQEHQDSWTRASDILEQSSSIQTKFFGLQILEDAIRYRWKILPKDQREGIKSYIVGKLLSMSSDESTLHSQRMFVNKMDLVLVQVLKHEWPQNWPSFITDIVNSSKTSEILCENNMTILKLLSEEVFDFSKDQLTEQKTKTLKESLNHEFTQIFQLCEFVLNKSTHVPLLQITLQTLLRFLSWIPLGFIFETDLIKILVTKFLATGVFRNDTISCLSEIAQLRDVPEQYNNVYVQLYMGVLNEVGKILPPGNSFTPFWEQDEVYVQRLSIFFTSFFRYHIQVIERPITAPGDEAHQALLAGFTYLVCIAEVDDDSIFKICLDYWHFFTRDLYTVDQNQMNPLAGFQNQSRSRRELVSPVMNRVRHVMISKMVKPSEVLIVEDENGEIVRETTKDTEALSQYKTMHETLVYLTHLNYDDTETIMLEKLTAQVEGTEWSWNNLNTLCWAIGSISGAMSEENEKRFLVTVIKDLLGLCEMKRGKDNKAVVASNIMYVVGQYPRFLRAHWKFLRTVVNKLFEFMHELHPGVQDMACDTFLKISQKCRRKFVVLQSGESRPFVEELLEELPRIVSDLETHQVHTFYEAVASMLAAENDAGRKEVLLGRLMNLPNEAWKSIMSQASQDVNILYDSRGIKEIVKIIRTNVRVCKAIGPNGFNSQMGYIFQDMLNVYVAYTQRIAAMVEQGGEIAVKTSEVRSLRSAKKESLRLMDAFVEHTAGDDSSRQFVATHFLPKLLETILADYQNTTPTAKESEVLSLLATSINKLKNIIAPTVPMILEAVFECTLQMITKNFEDFPEHRVNFFKLLQAVNDFCFEALFSIPQEHQKLVVDSIIWAFKHTERNVADTGLATLFALLLNIQENPQIAAGFYRSFYLLLLQDILAVLTDRLHKFGFKLHAAILRHMFAIVESNHVAVPLWESVPNAGPVPPGQTNSAFLKDYVANLIGSSFPNLSRAQVVEFVVGCFDMSKDLPTFKKHLRDFLVNIKEFAGEDNAELFLEENLARTQLQEKQDMAAKLAVPGLVNPNERPDEMADL